jgi:hypothetical protein
MIKHTTITLNGQTVTRVMMGDIGLKTFRNNLLEMGYEVDMQYPGRDISGTDMQTVALSGADNLADVFTMAIEAEI